MEYLKFLSEDSRRQKATNIMRISFFLSEGKSFVVAWISQQSVSTVTQME
jgi:hypothetical protein